MQSFKKDIEALKAVFHKKKQSQLEADRLLRAKLGELFPGIELTRHLRSWSLKNKNLFIETTNKSFAQEIFLKRERILREINQPSFRVEKIIVS